MVGSGGGGCGVGGRVGSPQGLTGNRYARLRETVVVRLGQRGRSRRGAGRPGRPRPLCGDGQARLSEAAWARLSPSPQACVCTEAGHRGSVRRSHAGSRAEGAVFISNIPGSTWRSGEGAPRVLCLQLDAVAQRLHGPLFLTPELVSGPTGPRGPGRAVRTPGAAAGLKTPLPASCVRLLAGRVRSGHWAGDRNRLASHLEWQCPPPRGQFGTICREGRCSAAVNLGAPRPGGCCGHGVAGSSAHRQLCCVTGPPSADCCPGVGEHTLCQRCSSRPRGRRDVLRPRVRRPSLAVHWSALPGTGFPSRLAKGDGAVLPADVGLTAVPSSTQQLPGVLCRAPRVQEQQSPPRGPQSLRRRTCHASAVRPSRPLCSVA